MKVIVPPAEFPDDGHPRTLAESWMHGPRWDLGVAAYEQLSRNAAKPDRNTELPVACGAAAFTSDEREKWHGLTKRFIVDVKVRRELPSGHAFEFERTPDTLRDLAQYVEFESRCCPFVDFTVRVLAGGKVAVLEMTGRDGVKELLAAELGLD